MKRKHNNIWQAVLVICLLSVTPLLGWSGIKSFSAFVQNGKIAVEWQTSQEENVDFFVVQRSMNGGESYYDLSKVYPHGNGYAYLYVDERVLGKTAEMSYTYRLKIYFRDKSLAFSDPVDVVMSVSSVQHTWGSIKAMFQ